MKKLRIAVLASTRGTDMLAIMDAIKKEEINAEICCLLTDKAGCGAVEKARASNIPVYAFNKPDYSSREEFDAAMLKTLEEKKAELILLIGYMRIISKPFVEKYRNKIMNIHPSLLPAFGGGMDKDVHQAILEHGCKVSGCTLHFVTEELDAGPIIAQKPVPIEEGETAESLKEKVQKAEGQAFVEAIKKFSEGKLKLEGRIVRVLP